MRTPVEAKRVGGGSPEPPLPDALHAVLRDRWPFCCERILHDSCAGDAVPLTGPDAGRAVYDCFERWCGEMQGEDRRGLGSLWTQWYAVTVWPALVAGILLLGRAPRFERRETRLLVDEDGCPCGLGIAPDVQSGDPATLLDMLTGEHAATVIDTVAEATSTAPRVPWSNVANVLGWTLSELGAVADEATLAPGYGLLTRRRQPNGDPNPLYLGQSCVAAAERPARRVCCLRYRLTGFDYCGDCPIACR